MMYFSRTFTLLLRRMEATLTKSSLLRESFNKLAPKSKFLVSNNDAILTYWPVKNIFSRFHNLDSATFELLNCLDRISLMSYKKSLNDK